MHHTHSSGEDALCLPPGFRAAGLHAGLKKDGVKDMALIVSDVDATVAGVFTTNLVHAAPVKISRARIEAGGSARAIIVNSGNANACTGPSGMADARRMTELTAGSLGVPDEQVLICSTGSIGIPLPMPVIESGIRTLTERVSPEGGMDAAEAILTTDLRVKHWTVPLTVDGQAVTVSGIAKGAGMIEPNMATMLAFLMTDAVVERDALQQALTAAVNDSFNRITVDGDQSTNDTVLMLANGVAGHSPLSAAHPDWQAFCSALNEVALRLAHKIVGDGEGAKKFITVIVEGADNDAEADLGARAIANSFLVKTSWAGAYPNWGRVMDCLGYSGARVVEDRVRIWYDELQAVENGISVGTPSAELKDVILRPRFTLRADLGLGTGRAVIYTCEITEEYVRINVT